MKKPKGDINYINVGIIYMDKKKINALEEKEKKNYAQFANFSDTQIYIQYMYIYIYFDIYLIILSTIMQKLYIRLTSIYETLLACGVYIEQFE